MVKNIFLVGPASVGKSTVARLLADKLNYRFIDVDAEFCERVGLIPEVVKAEGYRAYCQKNSVLVDQLLTENPEKSVIATPSGYLVHEDSPDLVEKHQNVIRTGISILLLPDEDPNRGVGTIVARQLNRWSDIDPDTERERFLSRFDKYKNYGDIKIFSMQCPEAIVQSVLVELQTIL